MPVLVGQLHRVILLDVHEHDGAVEAAPSALLGWLLLQDHVDGRNAR